MTTSHPTDRELRVLDQSVTAYSVLRDRYGRRDAIVRSTIIAASALVTALAIASDDFLNALGISGPAVLKAWLAVAGIVLFVASILSARLDWAGRSLVYGQAADACARLKARYREALEAEDPSQSGRVADVRREYLITNSWLPRIPDDQFVALKAAHRRKVALSRLVDNHQFAQRWIVQVVWAIRHTKAALKRGPHDAK